MNTDDAPGSAISPRLRPVATWLPPAFLLVLGLSFLDRWSMWRAEIWTWYATGDSFVRTWEMVRADLHPPLYFAVEWLVSRLSDSDRALRTPSLLAATGTVWVIAGVARRHLGQRTGLLVALLAATSPSLVVAGLTARGSAASALLAAGVLWAALEVVRGPRPVRGAVWLGAALAVGLYTHYSLAGAWVAAAVGVPLGAWWSEDAAARRTRLVAGTAAVALAALAFLPWWALVLTEQPVFQEVGPRSLAILRYLLWPVGSAVFPFAATLGLALAAYGVGRAALRRSPGDALLLGWVVAAIAVPWWWSSRSDTWWKYYIYAPFLVPFLLLVGQGLAGLLDRTGWQRLWAPTTAVLVGLQLFALWATLRLPGSHLAPSDREPAVYDARIELEAIHALGPTAAALPGGADIWAEVSRYETAEPITRGPALPWTVGRRRPGWELRAGSQWESTPECVFQSGFSAWIVVGTVPQCNKLREVVARLAEEHDYGPFWLEQADYEAWRGEWVEAERLALRAAARMPASPAPHDLLARMYLAQGRAEEALDAAREATERDLTWAGRTWTPSLAILQMRALRSLGRTEEATEVEAWAWCIGAREPALLCGTWLAGSGVSRWLAHDASGPRPPASR